LAYKSKTLEDCRVSFFNNMESQQKQENKSFNLDKAVKISIMAGVLLIALSVAYYLFIFSPKKEAVALEAQKQQLEFQKAQADEQQAQQQKEQQTLEQQAAAAKQTADQQAATDKAAAEKAAYNKQQLNACLNTASKTYQQGLDLGVKMGEMTGWAFIPSAFTPENLKQDYEFAVNKCYQMYPQN
jgi:hypothetical protein